jgi:hypothetical protein
VAAQPPTDDPDYKPDWRDFEIKTKHRQLKARDDELARIRDENKRLQELADAAAKGKEQPTPPDNRRFYRSEEEYQADLKREAGEQAAQQLMATRMSSAQSEGIKQYGADKWGQIVERLQTLGAFTPEQFQQVMVTDNPTKVIYELGNKPEEYQRIMAMDPYSRANELAKLAIAKPPLARVSAAPPPVNPVDQRGAPASATELTDDLPEDEWHRRRNAIKAASTGRLWSTRRA